MGYEQVDVFVVDDGLQGAPVPDVLVRVYSPDGKTLFGESTTDAAGQAGFLLAEQEYSLRFFKFAYSFRQPQLFTVEAGEPNQYTVHASTLDKPIAADPRLCRASGYFRDASGHPRQYLDIHFIADFRPAILDGSLVMDERRTIKTTKEGFGCIDLVRCACYSVTIEAFEDEVRTIRIPDSPCVNLPDLLFPVVSKIVQAPVSVAVNAEQELYPEVYDSAGVPIPGTARGDVRWTMEDPSIAQLSITNERLLIKGLTAGTTALKAERTDSSIIKIPDAGIDGVPIAVTVG